MLTTLFRPGLEPWIAAAALAVSCAVVRTGVGGAFFAPALLTTAVLLLATGRTWASHRRAAEPVVLAITQFTAALLIVTQLPHSFAVALLPLCTLTLIVAVQAFCAWRFAADEGQTGPWWVLRWALPASLGPAFGLFFTLPVVLCLVGQTAPLGIALLVTGATLLGWQLQRMLTPLRAAHSAQF